jgi:transcriptional regulator with XRE-family HTH domain
MSTARSDIPLRQLGKRVSKVRRLKGYSEEYMAQQLGISQRQYSRYETGESAIAPEKLEAIANVLECELQDLLSFDEKLFFTKCTGVVGINTNNTYHAASDKELQLLHERIKHLEEEVHFLRRQLEAKAG